MTQETTSAQPLLQAHALGQRLWLDNLSRHLLQSGELQRLIEADKIAGVTSNPSIFYKSIRDGAEYAADRAALRQRADLSPEQRYEALVIPDIQAACDVMAGLYQQSGGQDGLVSLEVSPALAHDAAGTVAAGLRLWQQVDRPNLMIKVPATQEGCLAIHQLIAAGVNVNVTLMFSQAHVLLVEEAYLAGLEDRLARGLSLQGLRSVASVFMSRVDTLVDQILAGLVEQHPEAAKALGHSALDLAERAWHHQQSTLASPRWARLAAAGANVQRLLWASTGTKNPAYSDVLYVEGLLAPNTVNTLPDATLAAFRDHGRVNGPTLGLHFSAAQTRVVHLASLGVDLNACGEKLQQEGLKQFSDAFAALLALMD